MAMLMTGELSAQYVIDGQKMEVVENRVIVEDSHQEVWQALTVFGKVSEIQATIDDSRSLNGTNEQAVLGAEREIQIPDGINNIINKERIITFMDGIYYTYEVYEAENFPTRKMLITYGVRLDEKGRTILYNKTYYKLNNKLNTKLQKRKLDRLSMESLLAYKHYIETGETDVSVKPLRKQYQQKDQTYNADYLAVGSSKN